ncbi:myogenesis-regulating glycosidase-like [Biomphalaria glabrata]|uniref:Myogenesis-regulating glycosidase-like n=1 Tax=Biomphalaria glabrata TaxID=6526 RepID=A0A9U8ECI2_BIOGL|nr:myogenesis-regulating glycosidase-like [Biomphalaria glabrata]
MKETLLDLESEEKQIMGLPKRKLSKIIKIIILIILLVIFLIVITTFSWRGSLKNVPTIILTEKDESVVLDENTEMLIFNDPDLDEKYLSISFQHKLQNSRFKTTSCDDFIDKSKLGQFKHKDPDDLKLEWKPTICQMFENDIKLAVYEDHVGIKCHTVHWISENKDSEIVNCLDISDDNWYGGGGLSIQRWPLNRVNVPLQPYITRRFTPETQTDEANFDSFIEPFFISAKGTVILVEPYLPLFVSINHNSNKKLCFKSSYQNPYNLHESKADNISLKYKVCHDRRGRAAHWHFLEWKALDHSTVAPPSEMLIKPIWSTRGINTDNIKQSTVLSLVKNIKDSDLPYSQLFIDGNYSKSMGNFYFNENTFRNSHQLIMEFRSDLVSDKLQVGTEVFPFVSETKFALQFKPRQNSNTYGNVSLPLHLNVFNKEAVTWYNKHLKSVYKELTTRGFRFSGGHAFDIVQEDVHLNLQNSTFHLNKFTNHYAAIASLFGEHCLIGSGYKSQNYTVIADAGPMLASWNHKKGLQSIIPTTLTYGLMGYPFVLTGPIGGVDMLGKLFNGNFPPPEKELFIRWLQIAVFLPVMEFSSGPWLYGEEVVNYTKKMLEYRQSVLWPKYLDPASSEATEVGTPIARPLWYIFPDDKTAQFIDCEFFLGNSLLVAPVLYANARHRDIYLPDAPWWRDQLHDQYYTGGQWLRNFPVDLYEIATFVQERPQKKTENLK